MKKTIITLLIVWVAIFTLSAKAPQWFVERPTDPQYYIGIGSASVSAANYAERSAQSALANLVSEIGVKVESNSLWNYVNDNGKFSDVFKNEATTHADAYLEGHELVDTYNDGDNYWTYYRIRKDVYEKLVQRRTDEAKKQGYKYYEQGRAAIAKGDLETALGLFSKGLDAVAPFADKSLEINGADVAIELYKQLVDLFKGVAISVEPKQVALTPFSNETATVTVKVAKDGVGLMGVSVEAKLTGDKAKVSKPNVTDREGKTTFTVGDLASRDVRAEIIVTPKMQGIQAEVPSTIAEVLASTIRDFPSATVDVVVKEASTLRAYFECKGCNDDNPVCTDVKRYLINNYFDEASSSADADVIVDIKVSYRKGGVVKGNATDMQESFVSCDGKIKDKATGATVASFGVTDVRSLSPVKNSPEKAESAAYRDAFRKLKPIIAKRMKETKLPIRHTGE